MPRMGASMQKGEPESYLFRLATPLIMALILSLVFWVGNRNAHKAAIHQPPRHSAPAQSNR